MPDETTEAEMVNTAKRLTLEAMDAASLAEQKAGEAWSLLTELNARYVSDTRIRDLAEAGVSVRA